MTTRRLGLALAIALLVGCSSKDNRETKLDGALGIEWTPNPYELPWAEYSGEPQVQVIDDLSVDVFYGDISCTGSPQLPSAVAADYDEKTIRLLIDGVDRDSCGADTDDVQHEVFITVFLEQGISGRAVVAELRR